MLATNLPNKKRHQKHISTLENKISQGGIKVVIHTFLDGIEKPYIHQSNILFLFKILFFLHLRIRLCAKFKFYYLEKFFQKKKILSNNFYFCSEKYLLAVKLLILKNFPVKITRIERSEIANLFIVAIYILHIKLYGSYLFKFFKKIK